MEAIGALMLRYGHFPTASVMLRQMLDTGLGDQDGTGIRGSCSEHAVEANAIDMPTRAVRIADMVTLTRLRVAPSGADRKGLNMAVFKEALPDAQVYQRAADGWRQGFTDSRRGIRRALNDSDVKATAGQRNGRRSARRPSTDNDYVERFG